MAERMQADADSRKQQSVFESDATDAVRRLGGLLVQTGLQPSVFTTLQKKLGFGNGYRQMIQNARQKYILGKDPLPEKGTEEYRALADFMFHPDVFRQIVILQNRNLGGTTFVRPVEEVMTEVTQEIGTGDDGSLKTKDLGVLLSVLARSTFDAAKDKKLAKELGLTNEDVKRIETDPSARREYSAEISYGIKSKPPDLLADEATLEVFSHLSNPLSFSSGYVPASLRAVADYVRTRVDNGTIALNQREKEFVLRGFLPLFETENGALNQQLRVRLRNVLWGMQSYGLCSVPVARDGSGAIGLLPVTMNTRAMSVSGEESRETASVLFESFVKDFMAGESGEDTATGSDTVSIPLLRRSIEARQANGDLAATDAHAIERFLKRASNPIYRAVTRIVTGRRPTIGALKRRKDEVTRHVDAAKAQLSEIDTGFIRSLLSQPDALEKQLGLLTQRDRSLIEGRIAAFKRLSERFEGDDAEVRLDELGRRIRAVIDSPYALRTTEQRAELLTKLRSVHRDAVEAGQIVGLELESIKKEMRRLLGIRWDKSGRKWTDATRPETATTKFIGQIQRGIEEIERGPRYQQLRANVKTLEEGIHFFQSVVPQAERVLQQAREAIAAHGSDKPEAVAAVKKDVDTLLDCLRKKDAGDAKRLTIVLENSMQLLVPQVTRAPQVRDNLRRQRGTLREAIKAANVDKPQETEGVAAMRRGIFLTIGDQKTPEGRRHRKDKIDTFQLVKQAFLAQVSHIVRIEDDPLSIIVSVFQEDIGKEILDAKPQDIDTPEKRAAFAKRFDSIVAQIVEVLPKRKN